MSYFYPIKHDLSHGAQIAAARNCEATVLLLACAANLLIAKIKPGMQQEKQYNLFSH